MPGLLSQPRRSLFGTEMPMENPLREVMAWKPSSRPPTAEDVRNIFLPNRGVQQSDPIARMFPPPWATLHERPADTAARLYGIGNRTGDPRNLGHGLGQDPNTAENLSLGANAVYRDAIASAAQRTHRRPQILAAIINREAHRRADGVWDPNSRNGDHLGLGEFDPGTWIGEAERHGTYLNGIAGRLGYLDPHGRVRPEHRAELLDLRTDPTNSINATADYTEQNLVQLRRDGFTITPETEAAYAYYAHQNGLRGAEDLLRGRRHANERTFRGNVPAADQDRYLRRYPPRGPEFGSPYSAYLRDHLVDAAELDQFTTHPTRPNPPPRLPAVPRR